MAQPNFAVTFTKDKETDKKVRFNLQVGDVVGTVYLPKEKAGELTKLTGTLTLE